MESVFQNQNYCMWVKNNKIKRKQKKVNKNILTVNKNKKTMENKQRITINMKGLLSIYIDPAFLF